MSSVPALPLVPRVIKGAVIPIHRFIVRVSLPHASVLLSSRKRELDEVLIRNVVRVFRVDDNAVFHAPHAAVPSPLGETEVHFEEDLVVVVVHTTIDIPGCISTCYLST